MVLEILCLCEDKLEEVYCEVSAGNILLIFKCPSAKFLTFADGQ